MGGPDLQVARAMRSPQVQFHIIPLLYETMKILLDLAYTLIITQNVFSKKLVFPESDVLAEAVFEIDDSKYSELQKKKPTDLAAR